MRALIFLSLDIDLSRELIDIPKHSNDKLRVFDLRGSNDEGTIDETICGATDDRILSSDPRVGRLRRGSDRPCTAFLIDNNVFVTSGSCINGTDTDIEDVYVEFNVPPSDDDGSINDSDPEDVYEVEFDNIDIDFDDESLGKDWAVGRLVVNDITGDTAGEAQGCYFNIDLGEPTLSTETRVTGYGVRI